MGRWRVLLLLILAVGLASVAPSGVLGAPLGEAIRSHDGIAHGLTYLVVAVAACWALWPVLCAEPYWRPRYRTPRAGAGVSRQVLVILGVTLALALVGALMEVLQEVLHTERTLSCADMGANTAGAASGGLLWLAGRWLSRGRR
jgi:hypothetical protein